MENKKLTVKQLQKFWRAWEIDHGESFIDYFLDDNINDLGLVLGCWSVIYPDLFNYIMKESNWCIPWRGIQDGLSSLVEYYYASNIGPDGYIEFNEGEYELSILPWCEVIYRVDIYYERLLDFCKDYKIDLNTYGN